MKQRDKKRKSVEKTPSIMSNHKVVISNSNIEILNNFHDQKKLARDRQDLVLWKRPLITFYYFFLQLLHLIKQLVSKILKQKKLLILTFLLVVVLWVANETRGIHQQFVISAKKQVWWSLYWVGLGILSSVGLGTGLHTFLFYLGPHIAAVTLAAFECMSVDFPEPPYPDDIICPDIEGDSMSLWTIMGKVRWESFMWGAGTAIGELPPYFMARTSRLSGQEDENVDDDIEELERLIESGQSLEHLSFLERSKVFIHKMIHKVGFIGILLCASIPNPLFDLAGITCGHFLISFWTFFGATLIGKAIIKMHIQKLFVIFIFSEQHVDQVIYFIRKIPIFGAYVQTPFKDYLEKQKMKLHKSNQSKNIIESSWLSWIFEKIVLVMVIYFLISIINSLAQAFHKKLYKNKKKVLDKTEI